MKKVILSHATIQALIADGFIDRTKYRYVLRWYTPAAVVADRYELIAALFDVTPEIEPVRIVPR